MKKKNTQIAKIKNDDFEFKSFHLKMIPEWKK